MKSIRTTATIIVLFSLFISFRSVIQDTKLFSLTVEVHGLRNNEGSVVMALYNREDAFPDEHYQKYVRKITATIENGKATGMFGNLSEGKYAVNILHDEDNDGKIKKGFIVPKEGIGFSNYQSFGLGNRPKFSKASFMLENNMHIRIKVIYM